MSLSESVVPGTASHGKEIIHRETDSLRQDWEQFTDNLQQVWWCSGEGLGLLCRLLVMCIVVKVWDFYVDFYHMYSGGGLGLLCRLLLICIVVEVWDSYVDFYHMYSGGGLGLLCRLLVISIVVEVWDSYVDF